MAAAPTRPPLPPPPESTDSRAGADLKTETHAPPFLKRESESLFESPIKRSLSTDSEDEGAASYVPAKRRSWNLARDISVP